MLNAYVSISIHASLTFVLATEGPDFRSWAGGTRSMLLHACAELFPDVCTIIILLLWVHYVVINIVAIKINIKSLSLKLKLVQTVSTSIKTKLTMS